MTKPETPQDPDGKAVIKRKPFKKPVEESTKPVVPEAVPKERRRQVRTIPVPEVQESDSDSDWAKFGK